MKNFVPLQLNTVFVKEKPLIFVTNDDGVNARGLGFAIEIARKFGRVVAVAPEESQSGKAHAITMFNPLFLRKVQEEDDLTLYACSGTPVDCVKMAFDYLFQGALPALSISGINHGSNSAISVIYSGTMGAAIEASFYGIPSIGLSLTDHSAEADFTAAAAYGEEVVRQVMYNRPGLPLCLNVNIPDMPLEKIKGMKVCRQNKGYWQETFEVRRDPRGREYYWLSGDFYNEEPSSTDTDEWALKNGYVSIVPIKIDLTDYTQVKSLTEQLNLDPLSYE